MRIAIFLIFFIFLPTAANAQLSPSFGKEGEILSRPVCSYLTNRSDQTIMGTISTAGQRLDSGDIVKHRENFRLEAGQRRQFCAAGPFYEGQRLELVIRTLIPLFSCRTRIDREIFLDAVEDQYGFKKLSATCY